MMNWIMQVKILELQAPEGLRWEDNYHFQSQPGKEL